MAQHLKLDSGRYVSIQSVSIVNTYGGCEGNPLTLSRILWERMPERVRHSHGEHVVILKPSEPILPNYRFVASLSSTALPDEARWRLSGDKDIVLPLGFQWDYSFVTLCWFQNDLDGRLVEQIYKVARQLEWETHAKNSAY
jgi:hypothetical protein